MNYLLDEYPLVVLPSLAKKIGLNKAILLQQAHYWLQHTTQVQQGKKWFYKTHEEWQEEFPFWSISTIRRAISELEKDNLLVTGNFNQKKYDKTKWYTVNYQELYQSMNSRCVQNEQSVRSGRVQNEQMDEINLNRPIPDIITTTTTEDNVDKLANRFLELRGKGLIIKAQDYQAINRVLEKVPFQEAMMLLEGCFLDRPGINIHAFSYCEKYIVEHYGAVIERQKAVEAEKAREEHAKHTGRSQRSNQEKSSSSGAEEGPRHSKEQRLIGENGEIPDTECDY